MGMIKLPKESIENFYSNVNEIFESGNLAEGQWNKKISDWSCNYTSARNSIAVNSNGSGILALLIALKRYRKKKRIFLQSNTMYGVKTIAVSSGLELCTFIECELDYLMPTYKQVEDYIFKLEKPEECVFLITHIGGWVNPDIEKIADLCKEKKIALIEDCAHSLGSLLKGKHTGLFGDAGVYSLYATKAIPVGEGGIIVTDDDELSEIVEKFVIYDRFDQNIDIGVNFRMSEINALLSFSVLVKIELIIENKFKIAKKYIKYCNKFNWNYIDPLSNGQRSNLYKFILLSNSLSPAEEFEPIKTRTSPVYDYALGADPNEIVRRHICLPIWYSLDSSVVEKVLKELGNKSKNN